MGSVLLKVFDCRALTVMTMRRTGAFRGPGVFRGFLSAGRIDLAKGQSPFRNQIARL